MLNPCPRHAGISGFYFYSFICPRFYRRLFLFKSCGLWFWNPERVELLRKETNLIYSVSYISLTPNPNKSVFPPSLHEERGQNTKGVMGVSPVFKSNHSTLFGFKFNFSFNLQCTYQLFSRKATHRAA